MEPSKDSEDILFRPPPPPDIRIAYGKEPSQFGDLRLPKAPGPRPVLIVIHGGFWRNRYDLAHISYLCAALTAQGFATWNIEYRRLGDPGGGWPAMFLDVAAAVNHVQILATRYSLNLDRVVVMGHSAGGHLALWGAGRGRVPPDSPIYTANPLPLRAAISLAGVADLRRASQLRLSAGVTDELMGGNPNERPERYAAASPIELLPFGVSQYLLHGTADDNVPFEISQRYYETARTRGDQVELLPLPGTGHFELIDPESKAWPLLLHVVERACAPRG